ncbi:MAG: hypothetical protein ACKVOW_08375 [Chitinophagaceae bacterium]
MKKIYCCAFIFLTGAFNFIGFTQIKRKPVVNIFKTTLMQDSCSFTTIGRNTYFILEPGYQLVLEGAEKKDTTRLVITVLNETKLIGNVETRIVEENESINGKTVEISRNFFAFCKQTSSIFYFGEEVDIYKNDKVINHEGAWIAEGSNKAGIGLPGLFLLGSRYYQEIAPGIAMDRAEIISINEMMKTPAGKYFNVLKIEETTPLEPADISYKFYAPGIGLIKDGELLLQKYGYIK